MIEKILLAVDDSEGSRAAEALALEFGRTFGAEVVVLHVREWVFGPSGPFDEGSRSSFLAAESVARRLQEHGVRARPKVSAAFFARTPRRIIEVAESEGADLIVMGCHREAGHRRSHLGGATDRVLRLSTIPVLVTGPGSTKRRARIHRSAGTNAARRAFRGARLARDRTRSPLGEQASAGLKYGLRDDVAIDRAR